MGKRSVEGKENNNVVPWTDRGVELQGVEPFRVPIWPAVTGNAVQTNGMQEFAFKGLALQGKSNAGWSKQGQLQFFRLGPELPYTESCYMPGMAGRRRSLKQSSQQSIAAGNHVAAHPDGVRTLLQLLVVQLVRPPHRQMPGALPTEYEIWL